LLMGMVLAAVLTGCGSGVPDAVENKLEKSAEEYVQAAHEILEEADSFSATFVGQVQMQGSGSTETTGTVTAVKEPLFMHVDTVVAFDDMEQAYVTYLEETEDAVNQYMCYDGEWTEMTMAKDAALMGTQIYHTLYNMETILAAAEDWTAEKVDGDIVLSGSIPEERFYDVESYTRWFQLAGMSGLSEVYYNGVGDVQVEVFLDSKGVPFGYAVELAGALETLTNNVLTELGGGKLENPVEVEMYRIASELTQLDGVEAGEVPAEAKKDAINYEKEISMLENE
ncbi:MAG: hypothetical protein IKA89_04985, partial [Anaerotignum sp.]|nr:hypothetical protein [Anaerotignum sp.]